MKGDAESNRGIVRGTEKRQSDADRCSTADRDFKDNRTDL